MTECALAAIAAGLLVALFLLPKTHIAVVIIFLIILAVTLVSLALTACSNPGILPRYNVKPPHGEDWTYSDQTSTFRPRGAVYCGDCNCVIEGAALLCVLMPCQNSPVSCSCSCLPAQSLIIHVLGLGQALGSGTWGTSTCSLRAAVSCWSTSFLSQRWSSCFDEDFFKQEPEPKARRRRSRST